MTSRSLLVCLASAGLLAILSIGCSKKMQPSNTDPSAAMGGRVLVLNPNSTPTGNNVASISVAVIPQSIEFSPENSGFQYLLDIGSSNVEDQFGATVYQLTPSEQAQLQGILTGSIYANVPQIFALQGRGAPPLCDTLDPDYAVIVTNVGLLHLQGDGCRDYDLYNLSTFRIAGLQDFLTSVAKTIPALPIKITLSANSGLTGQSITISGTGFTATGNTVKFGQGLFGEYPVDLDSTGTLTFTIPSHITPPCINGQCSAVDMAVRPGIYNLSVFNSLGSSNTVQFNVLQFL